MFINGVLSDIDPDDDALLGKREQKKKKSGSTKVAGNFQLPSGGNERTLPTPASPIARTNSTRFSVNNGAPGASAEFNASGLNKVFGAQAHDAIKASAANYQQQQSQQANTLMNKSSVLDTIFKPRPAETPQPAPAPPLVPLSTPAPGTDQQPTQQKRQPKRIGSTPAPSINAPVETPEVPATPAEYVPTPTPVPRSPYVEMSFASGGAASTSPTSPFDGEWYKNPYVLVGGGLLVVLLATSGKRR